MRSLFLYAFLDQSKDEKKFTREDVTDALDQNGKVVNWFYSIPQTIFIEADMSAKELSMFIENKFGKHRHIITEVSENRWGRLPKEEWNRFP